MFIAALTYEYYHTGGLGFQQNLGGGGVTQTFSPYCGYVNS